MSEEKGSMSPRSAAPNSQQEVGELNFMIGLQVW
jgi:hypothetical protein